MVMRNKVSHDRKGHTCYSRLLHLHLYVLYLLLGVHSPLHGGIGIRPLLISIWSRFPFLICRWIRVGKSRSKIKRRVGRGKSDVHDSPPLADPLQRLHPPWLQFLVPLGVPLYPVDNILFDLTNKAPTRRFIQFDLCDARDANVYNQYRYMWEERD